MRAAYKCAILYPRVRKPRISVLLYFRDFRNVRISVFPYFRLTPGNAAWGRAYYACGVATWLRCAAGSLPVCKLLICKLLVCKLLIVELLICGLC